MYPIGSSIPASSLGRPAIAPDTARTRGGMPAPAMPQPARVPTAPTAARPATASAAGAGAGDVEEAPANTDPALWKVLTAEERAFFARQESMGPLTYGQRIVERAVVAPRGGRLNLRG